MTFNLTIALKIMLVLIGSFMLFSITMVDPSGRTRSIRPIVTLMLGLISFSLILLGIFI